MKELAIIIPVYKGNFIEETLASIASQTNNNFTLYIGDDNSPYEIKKVVDKFVSKIDIVYKRFDINVGHIDLVSQWERCIDMNKGESWIWLFSDDDVMESNCVEEFYNAINENPNVGLIHFNVNMICNGTKNIISLGKFPPFLSVKDYVDAKLKGYLNSFVVEFVIRRDIFYKNNRFENFDLAWGSDFVTWIKFAKAANGIYTCDGAKVYWRNSDENITTNLNNDILYRKMKSMIQYTKWILSFSQENGWGHPFFYSKYAFGEIKRNLEMLRCWQILRLIVQYIMEIRGYFLKILKDIIKYPSYRNRY